MNKIKELIKYVKESSREAKIFFSGQFLLFSILVLSIIALINYNNSIFVLGIVLVPIIEIVIFVIGYRIYYISELERAEERKRLEESGAELIDISYKEYVKLVKNGYIEKDGELISINGAVPYEETVDKRDIDWMSKEYIVKEN